MNAEQATARDPLRPTLLHLLRMTMTPDTPAIVEQESEQLGELIEGLRIEDRRRLLVFAVSLLGLATPTELAGLNMLARAMQVNVRLVVPR